MQAGDIVSVKGSRSGNHYEIYEIRSWYAILRPVGSDKQGGFGTALEELNIIKAVKHGNRRAKKSKTTHGL